MQLLRQPIHALAGRITVEATAGWGTEMAIAIPLDPPRAVDHPGRSRRTSAPRTPAMTFLGRAMESPELFNTQYVSVTSTNHSEKRSDYWIDVAADGQTAPE
jgi:hypothetical protein